MQKDATRDFHFDLPSTVQFTSSSLDMKGGQPFVPSCFQVAFNQSFGLFSALFLQRLSIPCKPYIRTTCLIRFLITGPL